MNKVNLMLSAIDNLLISQNKEDNKAFKTTKIALAIVISGYNKNKHKLMRKIENKSTL